MKKRTGSYIISAVGLIILFIAFLMFTSPTMHPRNIVASLKVTDLLTIVGGLLFIVPLYVDSVEVKTSHHVPNRWAWVWLPVVGMAFVVIGLLIPNSIWETGIFSLPDIFYLVGVLCMLPIFFYPANSINEELLEDDVENMTDTHTK